MDERPGQVTIGVLGVGVMGERHVRVLSELDGVTVSGVYDHDAERAAAVAERYGVPAFPSPQALFCASQAACIAASTAAHAELALAGLDHGVHLLIEKPLAANVAEAQRIAQRASRSPELVVAVGHIERFNPAYIAMKQVIAQRPIRRMTLRRASQPSTRCLDSDVVHDLMIHDIDLAFDMCGDAIAHIDAAGATSSGGPLDEAIAVLTLDGGASVTLVASRVAEQRNRTIDVRTDDAWISADLLGRTLTETRLGTAGPFPAAWPPDDSAALEVRCHPVPSAEPLRSELRWFVECIRMRKENVEIGVTHGLRAMLCAGAIVDITRRTVVGAEAGESRLVAI